MHSPADYKFVLRRVGLLSRREADDTVSSSGLREGGGVVLLLGADVALDGNSVSR